MLRTHFGVVCACLVAPISLIAQKPTVVQLIPAEAWRMSTSETLDVESIGAWGGNPAIEQEYGVQSIEHQIYFLADQTGIRDKTTQGINLQRADVILETASDPSNAYGLLTFYQTADMKQAAGMPFVLMGPSQGLMVHNRTFVRVFVSSQTGAKISDAELLNLFNTLGGRRQPVTDLVYLRGFLPRAGLVPGSEKYLLGIRAVQQVLPEFPAHLIGFSQGAEAHLGSYSDGKQTVSVLVITYPTAQIAKIRFEAMQNQMGVGQEHGGAGIYGKRTGSYVVLVLNSDSASRAKKLMSEFISSEQVTENVPAPGDEHIVRDMMSLVVANLIFSFILAGLAFGGGILFFLSMLAARKWFPQTFWGQPDEATIIRLRLN